MAELALDDVERHSFARHLDGMGVAQLVWREAPAHAGRAASSAQAGACGGAATMAARGSVR